MIGRTKVQVAVLVTTSVTKDTKIATSRLVSHIGRSLNTVNASLIVADNPDTC